MSDPATSLDPAQPIFIVGPSRSGTLLLQTVLNQNRAVWVVGETHYFDDFRLQLPGRGRVHLDEDAARHCEQYLLALSHRPYGQGGDPSQGRVDVTELRASARALGGTGDAYFEAYCQIRAQQHGRKRWGEKTPRHVFRIDDILAVQPAAKIVCLVRDPRAVNASYRDWQRDKAESPTGDEALAEDRLRAAHSYNVVLNALLWRAAMRAALQALRRYGDERIHLLFYENLTLEPEVTLKGLSEWLGLAYTEAMLDVPIVHSSYAMTGSGISSVPVERWRHALTPTEMSVVQSCCRSLMAELGYSSEPVSAPLHSLARTWLGLPVAVGRAALANRRRLGNAPEYVWRRLALAFGRD